MRGKTGQKREQEMHPELELESHVIGLAIWTIVIVNWLGDGCWEAWNWMYRTYSSSNMVIFQVISNPCVGLVVVACANQVGLVFLPTNVGQFCLKCLEYL